MDLLQLAAGEAGGRRPGELPEEIRRALDAPPRGGAPRAAAAAAAAQPAPPPQPLPKAAAARGQPAPPPQPLPKAAAARGRRPRGQPVLVPLAQCKAAAHRARSTAKADITTRLEAQMRNHNVRHAKTKASSPLLHPAPLLFLPRRTS